MRLYVKMVNFLNKITLFNFVWQQNINEAMLTELILRHKNLLTNMVYQKWHQTFYQTDSYSQEHFVFRWYITSGCT